MPSVNLTDFFLFNMLSDSNENDILLLLQQFL